MMLSGRDERAWVSGKTMAMVEVVEVESLHHFQAVCSQNYSQEVVLLLENQGEHRQ